MDTSSVCAAEHTSLASRLFEAGGVLRMRMGVRMRMRMGVRMMMGAGDDDVC